MTMAMRKSRVRSSPGVGAISALFFVVLGVGLLVDDNSTGKIACPYTCLSLRFPNLSLTHDDYIATPPAIGLL